ncbi:hypothetical protein [Fulvivirga ligni]|uniref:hypothetical protein n=1 Tax=Fulvivirga ligni TaxID=2904246 RepID=UPI001F229930|nr:hypothetical protein [Fulvivirga ligni]UII20549.1 hypothetical protein LVD16_22165 [Fulvivirga ligni]
MRIELSKNLPSIKELAETLKMRFSDQYTIKTFGLGKKSILVGKSTLVGAEISVNENEISLTSSPPTIFGGILMTLGMTELAIFLLPFFFKQGLSGNSGYRELEKEIGTFLTQKFN